MAGGPGNILIRVGADASSAVRELNSLGGPLGDVQTRGQRMGSVVRKAALPAVAVLGALAAAGISAAKAAAEDETSQVKLAGALTRTAGATQAQVAAAEEYMTSLSLATGVADDELRPALAKLASATGDVGVAQDRLKLALDISAQSGKSLDVVSKALAAAEDGRTKGLAKLVPGLNAATLESKNMTAITGELSSMVGGAATEAAGTATGQFKVMQVQLAELQEKIGAALIPIISALAAILIQVTGFASKHTTAAKILVGVIAALAAGVLVANAAMKAHAAASLISKAATATWTAIQWLLNAALTANPIGLVIVGIAALTAGVIIAYRRSETFRDVLGAIWDVIRNHPLALIIGRFGDLADIVSDAVGWIKKIDFPDVIAGSFSRLYTLVQNIVSWIGRIDFPSAPGWIDKLPGFGRLNPFSAPAAVARARPLGAGRVAGAGSPFPAGVGGAFAGGHAGGSIVINVFGATDPDGTARTIRRTLRGFERRHGAFGALAGDTGPARTAG